MAPDRPYEDGPDRPEQHLRRHDARPPPASAPSAEPRSREECYEALRAYDDGPARPGYAADGRSARSRSESEGSGWDSVDAAERPSPDAIQVSPERRGHILDGDKDGGGGHRHGVGKPGKTEFPANWDDEKIIDSVLDVARRPDKAVGHQEWNNRWVARGTRDDVEIVVVIARDGDVRSAWPPPGSPGVVKNPEEL